MPLDSFGVGYETSTYQVFLGVPINSGFIHRLELVKFVQGVWSIAAPAPSLLTCLPGVPVGGKVGAEHPGHPLEGLATCNAMSYPVPIFEGCF